MRNVLLRTAIAAAAGMVCLSAGSANPVGAAPGRIEAINEATPWRVYLVRQEQDKRRREPPTFTAAPPKDWASPDFDAGGWGRYVSLAAVLGGYGHGQSPDMAMLCLRTRFAVPHPGKAAALDLALEYRGGVVVYVNGREIARQDLPAGDLGVDALAEAYPKEVFVDPEGNPLRGAKRPADEHRDRYERRIRTLTCRIPPDALRRGSNVLALEIHPAPISMMKLGRKTEWSTAGVCNVRLTAPRGAGVAAYADARRLTSVWNASPMDTVSATPGKHQEGFLWWGVTVTPSGLVRGNPFEPLRPVRTVVPRGGTCAGQVVVTGPGPVKGLEAEIGPLTRAGGRETLPDDAVRIGYATQHEEAGEVFCNALMPSPDPAAAVQPVWVRVDVPRDQAPGWYTAALTLRLGGRTTRVPVQVLVSPWTVTDPRANETCVSVYQSPDTLAERFRVTPWSDAHFALIERSLRALAPMGNDVLLVPVILDTYLHHKTGLIRWVKKGGGYEPDLSAFARYYDLQTKVCGRPKVVTLSVWKHDFGCRTWFRGMKRDKVDPVVVTAVDPRTGKMAPMKAPHFGKPGSEAFWKPMVEGVKRLVAERGGDPAFVLLGEAFDSRPLPFVVDFWKKVAPDTRWQIYAHWVRDPAPENGVLTALEDMEVGFRINPNGGSLPEFDRHWPQDVPNREFYLAQAHRVDVHSTSSPLSFRVVWTSGTLARIGNDFWPIYHDDRDRLRSYYGCPPNEGWLWRGHVPYLTAGGPDGAVRTVQAQMLMEGLQECEGLVKLKRARVKAGPALASKIDAFFEARRQARVIGETLSQAMISMDLLGLAAREYALLAEIEGGAGAAEAATWDAPPPVEEAR